MEGVAEGADERFTVESGCRDWIGEAAASASIWEGGASGCVRSAMGAGCAAADDESTVTCAEE